MNIDTILYTMCLLTNKDDSDSNLCCIDYLMQDWNVVACTAERFFRVDRAQEHLHYLTDVANEALYVLDTLPQTPDDETAFPSPATSNHQSPNSLGGEVEQITPDLRWDTTLHCSLSR